MDPVREEDEAVSTFAFFHDCFEDIKEHEEVKNVVINLSDNGGGRACALVSVLGFLSEDGEVKMTLRDLVANNYREEYYHVDTNLDGIADDRDGYGGQYDFYIMCSGTSYSCANALPYYAQQSGLAKVIGCNPGGGDCVVASFADAYGRCAVYSGSLKLGREDENGVFVSDEKATTVDLNMMPSILDAADVPWFDADGIADAVHQYQNGAAEITYNDKEDAEKGSDFLMGLFEKMMARKIFEETLSIPGIHELDVRLSNSDRANRYDLMILLKMDQEALPAYDASEPHHRWKEEYGDRIDKKAIFDCE